MQDQTATSWNGAAPVWWLAATPDRLLLKGAEGMPLGRPDALSPRGLAATAAKETGSPRRGADPGHAGLELPPIRFSDSARPLG